MTIKEIAALAGVSTATVSRVFSKEGYVSAETKEKILKIAEENNFTVRKYGRKSHKSGAHGGIVGVVVPDINNSYYSEVVLGMEEVFDKYNVTVITCGSNEQHGKEIKILDALKSLDVSGIVIAPVSSAVEYNREYLINLDKNSVPVVLLDRDVLGAQMDGVFMDNYNGAYQSIQTLIDNGHRDIAFIAGPMTSSSALDRFNAYSAALRANNIPLREEYILYGDFKAESAYNLTKKLIDRKTRVTAIFSSNRKMSSGSLMALAEKCYEIGKDISFISCGCPDYRDSNISYVDYPTTNIGMECANILLKRITQGKRGSSVKARVTFGMNLVLKGSEKLPEGKIRKTGNM